MVHSFKQVVSCKTRTVLRMSGLCFASVGTLCYVMCGLIRVNKQGKDSP